MTTYVFKLSVPAKTPKENPVTARLRIEEGAISKVLILIPPGHQALAGLQLWYGLEQIFPRPPGSWLVGEDESIAFDELWIPPEEPYYIIVKGYNEDDTYAHAFYIRVVVMPREIANVALTIRRMGMRILRAIRELGGWI